MELKGFVSINKSDLKSALQQYKELHDKLVIYASSKFSSEVGTSIDLLLSYTRRKFKPEPLTEDLWMEQKLKPNGDHMLDDKGKYFLEENVIDKK